MTDEPTPEAPETATGAPETPETPVSAPEGPPEPSNPDPGVEALQAEIDALRAQNAALKVAAETGVPLPLLGTGSEDELRQRAEAVRAYAASQAPQAASAPPPIPVWPADHVGEDPDPAGSIVRRL